VDLNPRELYFPVSSFQVEYALPDIFNEIVLVICLHYRVNGDTAVGKYGYRAGGGYFPRCLYHILVSAPWQWLVTPLGYWNICSSARSGVALSARF